MEVLGVVVTYRPAVHVACAAHDTSATSFAGWYVVPLHAVQIVVFVSKANPAAQKLHSVPVNVVKV